MRIFVIAIVSILFQGQLATAAPSQDELAAKFIGRQKSQTSIPKTVEPGRQAIEALKKGREFLISQDGVQPGSATDESSGKIFHVSAGGVGYILYTERHSEICREKGYELQGTILAYSIECLDPSGEKAPGAIVEFNQDGSIRKYKVR